MTDYISRDTVLAELYREEPIENSGGTYNLYPPHHATIIERVKAIPAADVVPVRHGEWKPVSSYGNTSAMICECSECGDTVWVYYNSDRRWNYCPNCGAKMDGGDD